jgi:CheY-like chemotaxis protein
MTMTEITYPWPRKRRLWQLPDLSALLRVVLTQTSNGGGEGKATSVVIVDDDRALLGLLRVIFQDADFNVRTYLNAEEALVEVKSDQPDVIVLDLEMPVMNGRAFFRQLRADGIGTPILILSAYGAKSAQQELGAEGYVDKPFEPDQLVEAAKRLVAAR